MVRQAQLNPLGLDRQRFTVAVDGDDHIIGCVQIKPHCDGSRELASLVVAPECRQQGVGGLLVQHAMNEAGPPLWLMCRLSLTRYYRQFGFRKVKDGARMPPYFRRIFYVLTLVYRLLRRDMALAIMVWSETEA